MALKNKLHRLKEWEKLVKTLPAKVELCECSLDNGLVTKFIGTAIVNRKKRQFTWTGDGKCYYKGHRISQLDIPFNKA